MLSLTKPHLNSDEEKTANRTQNTTQEPEQTPKKILKLDDDTKAPDEIINTQTARNPQSSIEVVVHQTRGADDYFWTEARFGIITKPKRKLMTTETETRIQHSKGPGRQRSCTAQFSVYNNSKTHSPRATSSNRLRLHVQVQLSKPAHSPIQHSTC